MEKPKPKVKRVKLPTQKPPKSKIPAVKSDWLKDAYRTGPGWTGD